jgi:CubicO group peptidase (beta-lactamase class C family)/D-alanyl-D-alanine dipeptidase
MTGGALLGLLLAAQAAASPGDVAPRAGYEQIAARLGALIEEQRADKGLSAVSIALVDGQQVVWARGFGLADPDAKRPATAETVYRVGSVSKLFTDIGVMRLQEQGRLSVDAPVTRYLPDFQPRNPFPEAPPVSLRMLMSHHAGLIREPPVGNYFVTDEPSLADTIASLNTTALVLPPGKKSKYSNAGIAAVGYALELTQRRPFAPYLEDAVLVPLGMRRSSFEKKPELLRDLAKAYMWTQDGRVFEAPTFRFGMDPCGAMYSTVLDLGRFLRVLFARGAIPGGGRILKPETLEAMWTPQFAPPGTKRGFGIGFAVSELRGHRWIGHDGAVYGFATTLQALPDARLGAVVVTTKDFANAVIDRIAEEALGLMLARREGKALPSPAPPPQPIARDTALRLAGRYAKDDLRLDLEERGGALFLRHSQRDVSLRLKARGETLVSDDVYGMGETLEADGSRVKLGDDVFLRVEAPRPEPAPARWAGLIGEYGWDHNVLYIYEREGRLHCLIEWFTDYPLLEVSEDAYRFPDWGAYEGEPVVFTRDASGRATQVTAATVVWKRREVGPEQGGSFRLTPVRPVPELTQQALAAQPPQESGALLAPDLVELAALDATIRLDIRYAGSDNFLGTPVYREARAFLQRPAAEALLAAHRALARQGYGLLIHDAYRPWYVTKVFWDATPPEGKIFVADPSQGSRHNRGCAVDLTLYELATGRPVEMVGVYDEQSPRSFPDYPGGTSLARWQRALLRRAMEDAGFSVYEWEWWHFDFKDWRRYPILNLTFEQLAAKRAAQVSPAWPSDRERARVAARARRGAPRETAFPSPYVGRDRVGGR